MATLKGLLYSLKVTRNPIPVLSLMYKDGRKTVTFKNGFKFQLDWQQFRRFRDNYQLISKYEITQLENDLFKVKKDKSEITCPSRLISLICDLLQKYAIEQPALNSFKVKGNNFVIVGDSAMLGVIQEQDTGEYDYDYRGKTVLDVGGYQGESAVFFSRLGAKKVIIYEPVLANQRFIKENVSLNHVNAEIHEEGIGDHDGTVNVSYDEADTSFGLPSKSEHVMEIKVRNIATVMEESDADIAKFDCEGAEETLTHVPRETLRKIPFYIIEVHTPELNRLVVEKFKSAGFKLTKQIAKTPNISVIALEKNPA
jgi:FkbM family methyltransferase